ncbi:MAG TPA: hypothetical protein VH583_22330 [Vicinamibacterales bacterium]|jgi:hypothetical protein
MAFRFRLGAASLLVGLLVADTQLALAQMAPVPQPTSQTRGVFGGATGRNEQSSSVVVSAAEAYDSNVLGEQGPTQSLLQESGFYTELNAGLTLRAGKQKLQFSTAAGTDFRYYAPAGEVFGIGHYGNAGLTYHSSTSTTIAVDGGVAYAPSYLYRLFNTLAPPTLGEANIGGAYAVLDNPSFRYDARASVAKKISSRNTLTFRTGGSYTDFLHNDILYGGLPQRDLATFEAAAQFSRIINRDLSLNAGYTYRRAEYYSGVFPTEHNVSFGGDYTRLLSKTRRSHLKFNVSTAMLDAAAPGDPLGILRQQQQFAADVSFSRQFARTWQAQGGYNRSFGFIEGLTTPIFSDGVNVATSGLLSRRVDLSASAAYSVGTPVVFAQNRGFTTYTADVRTRMALNETYALYLEYLYYYYDFSRTLVPIGFPPQMARSSVRAGITLWFPLPRS